MWVLFASQAMHRTGKNTRSDSTISYEHTTLHRGPLVMAANIGVKQRVKLGETIEPEYAEGRVKPILLLSLEFLARPRQLRI